MQWRKNLGPVWAHSCFAFEAANGELHTLFHASHAVEKQVSFYLKRLVECWKCDAFVACMVDFAAEKPLHMQGRTKLSYMNLNCTCHRLSATLAHCTNCRVSITTRQSTGGHVQENGWTWNVYTHLIKAIVLVTCCFYMQEGPWHCWQTAKARITQAAKKTSCASIIFSHKIITTWQSCDSHLTPPPTWQLPPGSWW